MKSCMVLRRGLVASLMFLLLSGIQSVSAQGKLHLLKFDDVTQLRDFFKYTGNGSIIVSGHRGGYEEGYSGKLHRRFGKCAEADASFLRNRSSSDKR